MIPAGIYSQNLWHLPASDYLYEEISHSQYEGLFYVVLHGYWFFKLCYKMMKNAFDMFNSFQRHAFLSLRNAELFLFPIIFINLKLERQKN